MIARNEVQFAKDICTPSLLHRVSALLDRDTSDLREGDPMPPGWHVALFTAATPQSKLRSDGVGGLGFTLPASDLPRMVMGGRRIRFLGDIPIGARVTRESRTVSVVDKVGRSGPMCLMTVLHQIRVEGETGFALEEEQDYIMLSASSGADKTTTKSDRTQDRQPAERSRNITFDETMIFRYSAITFNAHRVHYDKDYARDNEGYSGVLVNGGLSGLFLLEMVKSFSQTPPSSFAIRNTATLLCGTLARFCATSEGSGWRLWIDDESGNVLSTAEAVS